MSNQHNKSPVFESIRDAGVEKRWVSELLEFLPSMPNDMLYDPACLKPRAMIGIDSEIIMSYAYTLPAGDVRGLYLDNLNL